ncbi:MAG: IS110 family transposase [Aureliella sp.]
MLLLRYKKQKAQFQKAETTCRYLRAVLSSRDVDLVVMEACGPSGWISDLCHELGLKTLICSTNDEAWQWSKVKRKTDRDDALKLARMASLKGLSPVHVPKPEVREWRTLIKYRKTLSGRKTAIQNSVRSLFANHGIEIDSGKRAWCRGRTRIDSFRKPLADCEMDELWRGQLDLELTQLDALEHQLDHTERRLEEIAKKSSHVQRLLTIRGVGRKTAEVLVATIDDPHRFKSGRQLSSYLGLVPKQYQSGQMDRNGRITKRGNSLTRTILVECAWVSTRYNAWSKATYERIRGGQSTRKKKAGIALARKIAVVAWAMMRDESRWEPDKIHKKWSTQSDHIKVSQQPSQPPGVLRSRPKEIAPPDPAGELTRT